MERLADAWWDDRDQEWVHGARDDQGRLVGLVHYWNADGVLISTCEHAAGAPHWLPGSVLSCEVGEPAVDQTSRARSLRGVVRGSEVARYRLRPCAAATR